MSDGIEARLGDARRGIRGARQALALLALASLLSPSAAASQQPVYGPPAPIGAAPASQAPPGIPLRLDAAAERALDTYPALAAARTQIRATQHDIKAAQWLRYPSVAVGVVTRSDRVGKVAPELQVVQPLWTGGRIKGSIDRATALRSVAQATLLETALDVLLRLSTAYFDIARTNRLQALYAESLAEHRRLVESMERRVFQEVSPQTDLELARARAAQVEQELGLAAAQHAAAMERFLQLVGDRKFDLGEEPQYSPAQHHPPGTDAVARALACDPTISRLNAEVAVAEADRRLSKAAIFPQVGVQYSYDRFGGSQVGLAVRSQTPGGLSPLALAEGAMARRQAAEFQVVSAERDISEKVNLDLVENRSDRTRIESSAAAAQSTAHVTESFLRQFVAGRRTWLDVMNAVREAVAARVALVEVESSAMSSSARLHLRTCAWKPEIGSRPGS